MAKRKFGECEEGPRLLAPRPPLFAGRLPLQEGHSDQQGPRELLGNILAPGPPQEPLVMGLEVPRGCCPWHLAQGWAAASRGHTLAERLTVVRQVEDDYQPENSPARASGPRAHARSQ